MRLGGCKRKQLDQIFSMQVVLSCLHAPLQSCEVSLIFDRIHQETVSAPVCSKCTVIKLAWVSDPNDIRLPTHKLIPEGDEQSQTKFGLELLFAAEF